MKVYIVNLSKVIVLSLFFIAVFQSKNVEAQFNRYGSMHGKGQYEPYKYDQIHPAYKDIQKEPSKGRDHVESKVDYGTQYPTSGPHYPYPTAPGFYKKIQPLEKLVHSLEHGNIVIYFDEPRKNDIEKIRSWVDRYTGDFDGVIAVPSKGLGKKLVLTAWQHRLELPQLDIRAAFFIDAFRGRGPERPVR